MSDGWVEKAIYFAAVLSLGTSNFSSFDVTFEGLSCCLKSTAVIAYAQLAYGVIRGVK